MGLDNPIHLALLLVIMLLVFGAKRLPEMGRSLGDGMRGFKEAIGGQGITETMQAAPVEPDTTHLAAASDLTAVSADNAEH